MKSYLIFVFMGCLSGAPLMLDETKEEILEGVELFIGGSVTAVASSWITTWLSVPMLALSETMIRALTGGISSLIFVLLTHLLHLIFTKGKGHDHAHSDEQEKIGRARISGGGNPRISGGNPQPQGSCCPGCSVAYCDAIQQRKQKKKYVSSPVEEDFSMIRYEERLFNFKDYLHERESITIPVDCTNMFCFEVGSGFTPSGSNDGKSFPFSTFPTSGSKSYNKFSSLGIKGRKRINAGIGESPNLDKQDNAKFSNQASKSIPNHEDQALIDNVAGKSAAVAEEMVVIESANAVNIA